MTATIDYWLSKLFFNLQNDRALASAYRADPDQVLKSYPLAPEVLHALKAGDVAALLPRTNGFLLRYYFFLTGMPDEVFLSKLHAVRDSAQAQLSVLNHG